jgi:hypothetical protein
MTKHLLRTLCHTTIAAVYLCLPATVLADRAAADALPDAAPPQRSEPLPLIVAEDAEAPTHRLVIPKAVLAKLAGDLPGAVPIAAVTPTRSMVAAIALSAAVACGLVAFRRGRPGRLAAVVLCGLALAGAGALLGGDPAFADLAAPDGSPRRPRPRPFAAGPESVTLARGSKVILEIGDAGTEDVVLFVGKPAAQSK